MNDDPIHEEEADPAELPQAYLAALAPLLQEWESPEDAVSRQDRDSRRNGRHRQGKQTRWASEPR